ncbi:ribosome-binding factor A [Salana multivorans]|uniref:Ribosome-binding factor A n=1 Tax=Salana multivorans TaxID=120377 RepID=A0A3N2D2B2_9MICO|nr:30S ribosome-binding factor RbfA [Salana multivorans]MBN8882695.1 30S ribosome-binding factor RbfA [Salana multivorans]OJX95655.1 MAG: ribosome-binding factor A [Micrococcales bacterium 73-15]ROR93909.1 ribosome-binding factor A [Salana multivorans]
MSDNSRAIRLGEAIKEIVATMLDTRIKDPRLGFVTVTGVKVTGDLQHATVFYTVLGDEAQATASAAALESAKGLLRSEVGKQTGVKFTPTLTFQLDHTPQTAADIAEALRVAAARDAEIRALAEGKQPAGEADPYRVAADEESDDASDDDADDELV